MKESQLQWARRSYSCRKASIGFIFVTRRAGRYAATSVTQTNSVVTTA